MSDSSKKNHSYYPSSRPQPADPVYTSGQGWSYGGCRGGGGGGQKSYSEVQSAEPLTESVKKHMNEFYNNVAETLFNLLNKFFGKVVFVN